MKTKTKIALLLTAAICAAHITLSAQKVKPVDYGGSITLMEVIDTRNTIVKVRVVGYGKKEAQAQEDAEVRAARMALYAGVDGIRPIFASEAQAEAKNGAFLNDFFESGRYKDYIGSVTPAGGLTKQKGLKVKRMPFDITVRIGAMERYFRTNGIIKLGY